MHWIIAIIAGLFLLGRVRPLQGAALHLSRCTPVPRDDLIGLIHSQATIAGCPTDLALMMAECESSIHNDRYNEAFRSGKHYAYQNLIRTHIKRNAGLKKWYEQSPWRDDPTAWGSYGVMQIHPHWVYQHIPAGEDHDQYMGDADFTVPVQCAKFENMWVRWGNCADVRLRYLGWKSFGYYLNRYSAVQSIAAKDRNQDQKRTISAIEKKIPRASRAYNAHGGSCRFFAPGEGALYRSLTI